MAKNGKFVCFSHADGRPCFYRAVCKLHFDSRKSYIDKPKHCLVTGGKDCLWREVKNFKDIEIPSLDSWKYCPEN